MNTNTPFLIASRVVFYSLLILGIAQGIKFDATHPVGGNFFAEINFTEITQEVILFFLFVFYLLPGYWFKPVVRPVTNVISLFFLISFIREFNFLLEQWMIPVFLILVLMIVLVVRDCRKTGMATKRFFDDPASSWFFSGFLIMYIFSRLFGRSAFWKLLYHDNSYRLSKAAVEEGTELPGNAIMLIGAEEWIIFLIADKKDRT